MKEYYCPSCKDVVALKERSADFVCAECGGPTEFLFSSASPAREMTGIEKSFVRSPTFTEREVPYEARLKTAIG